MSKKKALCIGINDYPGMDNDLSGCVNDASDWKTVLEKRGFAVQSLLNGQATKDAMVSGITQLVNGSSSGDVVVVAYSGHGSQIPDLDGDEIDKWDEVLCPYDIGQNRPLTDDELEEIFAEKPRGVRILLLSDSCHSGTITKFVPMPTDAKRPRARYLEPERFLSSATIKAVARRAVPRPVGISRPFGGVLISGCQELETSSDAEFDRRPNGAFTYYAIKALADVPPEATYREWHRAIRRYLPNPYFTQRPNLQGTRTQVGWRIFT